MLEDDKYSFKHLKKGYIILLHRIPKIKKILKAYISY